MNVLNDLLDFSKIEANHIEFETEPFRLCDLADRVENLHRLKAKEKDLSFRVRCEGDCRSRRVGDAHRIGQVVHNLLSNAIKFTESGVVDARIVAPSSDADPVLLEVSDTGIGVSEEQIARIFEPFSQADASTTRRFGGTGLGLSIAKGLVDAMGGELSVRSAKGEGTVFTIALPLPLTQAPAATSTASVTAETQIAELRRLRLLAAEDNAVNRTVLKALMEQHGHEIEFAEDGLEAVATFKNSRFDVVLMDISMPVMDGLEALRQIRFIERDRGAEQPIPVIAVSAHAMRQQIDEYLAAGFDGYVTKPVRVEQVCAELTRVTKRDGAARVA